MKGETCPAGLGRGTCPARLGRGKHELVRLGKVSNKLLGKQS